MTLDGVLAVTPLSPQQKGMLFGSLRAGRTGLFVEQESHTLHSRLDLDAFREAWQFVVDRHEMLRTVFVWRDQEEPAQVVLRSVTVPLHDEDWRSSPRSLQQRRLATYAASDRSKGFDLTEPPLFRLAVFRTDDSCYEFVWSVHHLVMDGWCRPILYDEVLDSYAALSNGRKPTLPPTRPYREYVAWVRRQDPLRAQVFWSGYLRGFRRPTPLGIEASTPDEVGDGPSSGRDELVLDEGTTRLLESIAHDRHLTMSVLVHGVWAALLSRYSGDEEVVFGTTVSGRPADLPGSEKTIGLFINTLPLRVRVPGDADAEADVYEWLRGLQAAHLEVRQFDYCSAGQIHQWSDAPGAVPLFESVLVFQNYPSSGRGERAEPSAGARFAGSETSYALTLLVAGGSQLTITAVHDTRRIGARDVAQILRHLHTALLDIAAGRVLRVGDLVSSVCADEVPVLHRLATPSEIVRPRVAPRTAVEERVADIWRELLGIDDISVYDDFFFRGGHSLLATMLVGRLRDALDVEIPLGQLFEHSTLEELAAIIEGIILDEIEGLSDAEIQQLVEKDA